MDWVLRANKTTWQPLLASGTLQWEAPRQLNIPLHSRSSSARSADRHPGCSTATFLFPFLPEARRWCYKSQQTGPLSGNPMPPANPTRRGCCFPPCRSDMGPVNTLGCRIVWDSLGKKSCPAGQGVHRQGYPSLKRMEQGPMAVPQNVLRPNTKSSEVHKLGWRSLPIM